MSNDSFAEHALNEIIEIASDNLPLGNRNAFNTIRGDQIVVDGDVLLALSIGPVKKMGKWGVKFF